ncbi:unnamed protein product [Thlaspi arvense]|uniref:F-box/kelch-repeat protein n=1 Tax=Thlaspi arvense TaxID=13288 RepID=A0AAU9S0L6_THLAR|nr:unnamed protein product [Thlaspi arvense]
MFALVWYDTEKCAWNDLEGLVGLPKLSHNSIRLADYGCKLVVLWSEYLPSSGEKIVRSEGFFL